MKGSTTLLAKVYKEFKSLDEQLDYLHEEKNIYFQKREDAKRMLLDHNYYNIISCGKIKFAEDIVNNHHQYQKSLLEEWYEYFLKDCQVSEYLMSNLIEFERIINSRTSYYVGKLIQGTFSSNLLNSNEKNELYMLIRSADISNLPSYSGKETWKYITKMSFGQMRQVLFWLLNNKPEIFELIFFDYSFITEKNDQQIKRLDNIILLRNFLFHFTPLSIYLGFSKRRDGTYRNKYRKEAVKFIFELKKDDSIHSDLKIIIKNANKFNKLKNKNKKNSQGLSQD